MSHAAAPREKWVAKAFATLPSQTLPPPGTAMPMLRPARGIYTRRFGWSDTGNHRPETAERSCDQRRLDPPKKPAEQVDIGLFPGAKAGQRSERKLRLSERHRRG